MRVDSLTHSLYNSHQLKDHLDLPHIGYPTYDGPSDYPLTEPSFLYLSEVFLGGSLALKSHRPSVDASHHIRGPSLRKDTPVDVNGFGSRYRVEVAEDWLHYPTIL